MVTVQVTNSVTLSVGPQRYRSGYSYVERHLDLPSSMVIHDRLGRQGQVWWTLFPKKGTWRQKERHIWDEIHLQRCVPLASCGNFKGEGLDTFRVLTQKS